MNDKKELGIYIHIPFCKQKCYYCDFVSYVDTVERMNKYIEKLKEEIEKSRKAISVLGGNINKIDFFELPQSDIKRNLIIIEKEKSTPAKFPRKPGVPSKEPIS